MVVLRLTHIGAGILWVGAAWMLFIFVTPTLEALGPETQRKFTTYILRQRRLATTILIATLLTVGAGVILLLIDISRYTPQVWFGSAFGIGITIGAFAAIGSFLLGPTFVLPLSSKLDKIGAEVEASGGPPTEAQQSELDATGKRLRTVLMWDSALLLVAVVLMAISRYL
jgi:hypothetical protein